MPPPTAVAPGDAIASSANNHHNFNFRQLGVRVPAVVVSPLIRRGTIDHTLYDHTSVARTLERLFGLKSLTARDAAANDFLHLFSLATARNDVPTTLPEPADSKLTCEPGLLTDLTDATDTLESTDAPTHDRSSAALAGAPAESRSSPALPPLKALHTILPPRPVPSSFWGFMRVALRKSLLTVPPGNRAERRRLAKEYLAVRNEEDARKFIHEARLRVRRYRRPGDEWRPLIMRRAKDSAEGGPGEGDTPKPTKE